MSQTWSVNIDPHVEICVSKFKQRRRKKLKRPLYFFTVGKVMFMCMVCLTLNPLSATSGGHGMLHQTQLVLLDPMAQQQEML